MLTSCPTLPEERLTLLDGGFDAPVSIDPISRSGPVGLPCQVENADLWFAETPEELEQAKSFCQACPARLACFAGATERREPCGVWGGEIFERGAVVERKRPRGRPRKADREVAA